MLSSSILTCFIVVLLVQDGIGYEYKSIHHRVRRFSPQSSNLSFVHHPESIEDHKDAINSTLTPLSTTSPSILKDNSTTVTTEKSLNITSQTNVTKQGNEISVADNVTIIHHNLGENNTGIRHLNETVTKQVNATSTPISVSEPITPDDQNSYDLEKFMKPQDKIFADNNAEKVINNFYEYYKSSFVVNKTAFSSYWDSLLKSGDLKTNNLLSTAHRKSVVTQISFDFPFYGQPLRNMTITTGGFIYNGDYIHSWLATTQYIAPLMANFDTSTFSDSFIKYIDNGTAFIVFWENVALQDRKNDGKFIFASVLHKNGDMAFAYKSIPFPVENIRSNKHPFKIGISDAFMIDEDVSGVPKKIIYEYHRVEFKDKPITNNSIIFLTALPTCPQYNTCSSCLNHNTVFKCSWCDSVQRCSHGQDRQRHEWLVGDCDATNITHIMQCSMYKHNNTTKEVFSTSPPFKSPIVLPENGGGGSVAVGIGIVSLIIGVVLLGWFVYAYRNPHTYSGQLLIKYRPAQWSWRRGEARYTAATIHM